MEAASSSETSLYLCHVVTLYTPEHTQSSNEIPYVLKDGLYKPRQFVNLCVISDLCNLGLPYAVLFRILVQLAVLCSKLCLLKDNDVFIHTFNE